jgi:hypothetical protein
MMNFIPGESIVLESDSKKLILTTHRIRLRTQGLGRAQIKSIMLEDLASCAMTRTTNPILLILAALAFIAGLVVASSNRGDAAGLGAGAFVAVILVVAYFVTQTQVLALASAGATITVGTKGMNLGDVEKLIDRIETAKNERYLIGKRTQGTQYAT